MRVVIYVPPARGADRTRRAIAREVRRLGHELRGAGTDSAAMAYAAWSTGEADLIAGRPDALVELSNRYVFARKPWALPVTAARSAYGAAVLAPFAWAAEQVRRHPARTGATTAALASLAAGLALALSPVDEPEDPGAIEPPARPSRSSAPRTPASPTLPPPPATSSPPAAPRPPTESPPPTGRNGGTGAGGPAGATATPPTSPPEPPASSTPAKTDPPVSSTPPPTTTPPPAARRFCFVQVGVLGVHVRLCVGQTSGLDS